MKNSFLVTIVGPIVIGINVGPGLVLFGNSSSTFLAQSALEREEIPDGRMEILAITAIELAIERILKSPKMKGDTAAWELQEPLDNFEEFQTKRGNKYIAGRFGDQFHYARRTVIGIRVEMKNLQGSTEEVPEESRRFLKRYEGNLAEVQDRLWAEILKRLLGSQVSKAANPSPVTHSKLKRRRANRRSKVTEPN